MGNPPIPVLDESSLAEWLTRARQEQWTALQVIGPFDLRSDAEIYAAIGQMEHICGSPQPRRFHGAVPLDEISSFIHLRHLRLSGFKYERVGLNKLVRLGGLITLDLSRNWIVHEEIGLLEKLARLTTLSLAETAIDDEGVSAFSQLSCLTSLDLSHNLLDDEGASAVAKIAGLTTLDLSWSQFGDAGIAKIARLSRLTSLALAWSKISPKGAAAIAKLSRLTSLNLAWNEIGSQGAAAISKLSRLRALELAANEVGPEGAASLAKLTRLIGLGLNSNNIGAQGAASIARLPHLTTLDLNGNAIGDAGAISLAALTNLVRLYAGANDIGDQGAAALAQLTSLTDLDLGINEITDSGTAAIGSLSNLISLDLRLNNISDVTVQGLAQAYRQGRLPQLRDLGLKHNRFQFLDESVVASRDARRIFDAILDGVTFHEVRVMFVGSGEAGKTWLYRRCFRDEVVKRDEPPSRTHACDLTHAEQCHWQPKIMIHDEERTVRPRIWDFGGQLVLHGLHEPFLHSHGRTVFVVVLAATRLPEAGDVARNVRGNRLTYWLRTIRHYAGEHAPIVVAVTQGDVPQPDGRAVDASISGLGRPVTDVHPAELAAWSGTWVTGIVDGLSACDRAVPIVPLRDAIENAVSLLDAVREARVPRQLLEVRGLARARLAGQAMVDVREFVSWCREAGVDDAEEQLSYLRMLDIMGDLLYLGLTPREQEERRQNFGHWSSSLPAGQRSYLNQDHDPLLDRFVVNPDWMKQIAYGLVRRSKDNPWLGDRDIRNEVAAYETPVDPLRGFEPHPDSADAVKAFLKRAGLCHYDAGRGEYLFPRGLPAGPPPGSADWTAATLRWEYFPEAAFHRFVVRMHAAGNIVQEDEVFGHFRNAVHVELPRGTRSIIVADPEEGRLEIRFDQHSAAAGREALYAFVREFFIGELLHQEPAEEVRFPAGPPPVHPSESAATLPELPDIEFERANAVRRIFEDLVHNANADETEFIHILFRRTWAEIPEAKGTAKARTAFRAGYFFRELVSFKALDSKLTSHRTVDAEAFPKDMSTVWAYLSRERVVPGGSDRDAGEGKAPIVAIKFWDLFGDPADQPKTLLAFEKAYSRAKNKYNHLFRSLQSEWLRYERPGRTVDGPTV